VRNKTVLSTWPIILIILITGCANTPDTLSYEEAVLANELLKSDQPEYLKYTIKGLSTIECQEGTCVMSEADFRQSEHDKDALLQLHKLSYKKDVLRVNAYNALVDAQSHNELALSKKDAAIWHLEKELRREKTYNALKTWAERALFIFGVWTFGSL